ncbi:hypothetical protein ACOANM_32150 [Pseudomonas aeruginosa]
MVTDESARADLSVTRIPFIGMATVGATWLRLAVTKEELVMVRILAHFGSFRRFCKVRALCAAGYRGVHKRIDENRELLELLQRESPGLLQRCPWIEGWLESQDGFLSDLADAVGTPNRLDRPDFRFPRPWPGSERREA